MALLFEAQRGGRLGNQTFVETKLFPYVVLSIGLLLGSVLFVACAIKAVRSFLNERRLPLQQTD